MKAILLFSLAALLALSGCIQEAPDKGPATADPLSGDPTYECTQLCNSARSQEISLESGPCLSDNNPFWDISDWVCDIAHSPRQDIDNQPENQCADFRQGKASHFVELSPECGFIKKV